MQQVFQEIGTRRHPVVQVGEVMVCKDIMPEEQIIFLIREHVGMVAIKAYLTTMEVLAAAVDVVEMVNLVEEEVVTPVVEVAIIGQVLQIRDMAVGKAEAALMQVPIK